MGQCLRGKMTDAGLFPAPPPAAIADTGAATESEADLNLATADEAVPAEPALDVTPPADATDPADAVDPEVADDVITATFGLLRAEPDGSVVIAGSGTPGTEVEIFANDALLGSADVESSGDWAFVPDTPLPPGGLEITLGEAGKPGRASQSFVVVINEDKTTQPLVVASVPGEASEVLQGLTAPTQIAAVPAQQAETPAQAAEKPASDVAAAVETPAAGDDTPAVADTAEAAAQPDTQVASAPEDATASDEPASADVAASAADPAVPATDAATDVATTADTETPAASAGDPTVASADADPVPAEPETAVASADPVADKPAETTEQLPAAVAVVAPTIDAIEKDGDRTFFAGAGPEGGVVRLYVNDSHVADATVADGRWLVEAGPVLDNPSQRVRVDLLANGTSDVVARAEVDFIVDVPAEEPPLSVAQADTPAQPAAPEQPAEAADPQPADVAPPATQPEVAADPVPVAAPVEAPAATSDQPAAGAAPSAPASEEVPAAAEAPAQPAEVEAAPVSDEPPVPTMVAVSLGDPEAQRFASGKAIIRRGDNLWTIARRVYGEGLKYTTIYEANTGQIRDPNRIYPGQVFDLPTGAPAQ